LSTTIALNGVSSNSVDFVGIKTTVTNMLNISSDSVFVSLSGSRRRSVSSVSLTLVTTTAAQSALQASLTAVLNSQAFFTALQSLMGGLTSLSATTVQAQTAPSQSSGSSSGALVGIIVGCVVGGIILLVIVILVVRKRAGASAPSSQAGPAVANFGYDNPSFANTLPVWKHFKSAGLNSEEEDL